jgi:TPR repeat protein
MRYLAIVVLCCATAFAQDSPAELYERGLNALTGSPNARNGFTAFDLVDRSARAGYAPAQVTLGLSWDDGFDYRGKDVAQAAYWYRKAAEQGDVLAQWLLGRLYVLGSGREEDEKWLEKAAERANPFAEYLLAMSLEDSQPKQAMSLYQAAAEQGLPFAQFRLGLGLRNGKGIAENKFEAYVWLLLSSSKIPVHPNLLALLESDLGGPDVEKAKSEARKRDETVRRSVQAEGCAWPGALAEIPSPPPLGVQRFCEQQDRPIRVFEQDKVEKKK